MIDAVELAMRLLASLEEAGSDRLEPLINTIMEPSGEDNEVAAFQDALIYLMDKKHIDLLLTSIPGGEQSLSKEQALEEISALSQYYQFRADERLWKDGRFNGPPFYQNPEPAAALTLEGRHASQYVLEDKGYDWWRSKQSLV